MNTRLELFMRSEGLTAAKLAEILSVQPSSISHLLSGRNNPNFEFISRILRMFPELNPDWIINGQGGMYRDKSVVDIENKPIEEVGTGHENIEPKLPINKEFTEITNVTTSNCDDKPNSIEDNPINGTYNDQTLLSNHNQQSDYKFNNNKLANDKITVESHPNPKLNIINSNLDENLDVEHIKTEHLPLADEKEQEPVVKKIFVIYSDKTFEIYNQK